MSLKEWGVHIGTAESKAQAREMIRQCNVALSIMPLTHDEKMAIEFHAKHIMRPGRKPKKNTYYIYAKNLPQRWPL